MEKTYKIAVANCQASKISTPNMSKKCSKSAKMSKNAQNCTKNAKTFNKPREKKISTAVKN